MLSDLFLVLFQFQLLFPSGSGSDFSLVPVDLKSGRSQNTEAMETQTECNWTQLGMWRNAKSTGKDIDKKLMEHERN